MSRTGFERDIPLIPAIYTLMLARFLRRFGIDQGSFIAGTDVPESALRDPEAYLSIAQSLRLIERACSLLPRPGMGFEYGKELDLSVHGLLGFSVLRRASVRELTRMMVDYLRIRMPLMELRLASIGNSTLSLRVEDSWDLGAARRFVVESYMGSIYTLTAPAFRDIEICFDFPQPKNLHFSRLAHCPVSFGHDVNHLRVKLTSADTRTVDMRSTPLYADQSARAALISEEHYGIALRVRHSIMSNPGRHSTLECVAVELGLSPRSLRRHLQTDGSSFTDIRNSIRKQFALRYLRGSTLPLETIADRLGYGDQASFTRAFRDWTGISPGRYRRGDGEEKSGFSDDTETHPEAVSGSP